LWPCKSRGHENPDAAIVSENCGALRDENIGDSGDNKEDGKFVGVLLLTKVYLFDQPIFRTSAL
jgi:hypothetical protein